jgi:hypothetical protein
MAVQPCTTLTLNSPMETLCRKRDNQLAAQTEGHSKMCMKCQSKQISKS